MRQALRNILASPGTSAVGLAMIGSTVLTVSRNVAAIGEPHTYLNLFAGLALLIARDPKKK